MATSSTSLLGLKVPGRPGGRGPRPAAQDRQPDPDAVQRARRVPVRQLHGQGENFHPEIVGSWGEHLRNQLHGCGGTLTGWTFDYHTRTGDDWWDWVAEFNLPYAQRKCAGHAIQAVGGGGAKDAKCE
ncbi:hypothetical protein PG994_003882 [Apiospora phragmitis]|uniref:Uncharacterized protein n=1 Tax=Apiospora phragmitis TaxID=2905665 RepID=A0ABR1W2C4_9PEZI